MTEFSSLCLFVSDRSYSYIVHSLHSLHSSSLDPHSLPSSFVRKSHLPVFPCTPLASSTFFLYMLLCLHQPSLALIPKAKSLYWILKSCTSWSSGTPSFHYLMCISQLFLCIDLCSLLSSKVILLPPPNSTNSFCICITHLFLSVESYTLACVYVPFVYAVILKQLWFFLI